MKSILFAVALALSGCAGVTAGLPPAPVVSLSATTTDERAYAQALNAYNAAGQAYLAANRAGLVSPSIKERVKAASRKTIAALNAADTALKAGNAPTFAAQLALATQAVAEIQSLTPKGN